MISTQIKNSKSDDECDREVSVIMSNPVLDTDNLESLEISKNKRKVSINEATQVHQYPRRKDYSDDEITLGSDSESSVTEEENKSYLVKRSIHLIKRGDMVFYDSSNSIVVQVTRKFILLTVPKNGKEKLILKNSVSFLWVHQK